MNNGPALLHRYRGRGEWLAFFLAFLVFAVFGGHALVEERARVGAQERERLQAQVQVVDQVIGYRIEAIDAVLTSMQDARRFAGLAGFDASSPQGLQAMLRVVPGVQTLLVIDAGGVVKSSSHPELVGLDVSHRRFFQDAMPEGLADRLYVAESSIPSAGNPTIHLMRRLTDEQGVFLGVVAAAVDQASIAGVLRSVHYAPDMAVTLFRSGGQALIATGDHAAPLASDLQRDGMVLDGGRLSARRRIQAAEAAMAAPLYLSASRPIASVYRTWRERSVIYLAFYATVFLACAALLYVRQRRHRLVEQFRIQREIERHAHAERLEFMLSGADVGLWDWDVAADRMVCNLRWYTMLGLSEHCIGNHPEDWLALVHADDIAPLRLSLARHWSGDTVVHEAEYRMRHKSGEWIWILDRGKVMQRDAAGAPLRMVGAHMDVTQHKRADEALRRSELRFRALTELSSDWYWELDEQHRFVRLEGYADIQTGLPENDHIGLTRWDLGALNMTESDWTRHRATLDAHETFHEFELQRLDTSGTVYWVSISGAPIFDEQGRFRGYRGIGRSITERKRVEDEIERLAFYDALTGLPNRRLLLDRLVAALGHCRGRGQRGALLFIDLDNFKDLNDTMGHDVGDSLLERVANRLVTCVKTGDTVARLGGDEFVVMLEGLPNDDEAAAVHARSVGDRVLATLNHPYLLEGYQHHSTPSIGVALFDGRLQSIDDLMKRADLAMYQAKAAGRNTQCFFHPDMQQSVIARAALESDLRLAIAHDELLLYYQPVVDQRGSLSGAEALLRWRHPVRGLVMPGEFIPLAEQNGQILAIGQWVIERACEQLVQWAAQPETRGLTLAINVSARQFRQLDFVAQMQAILLRTGVRAERLKIELTESLLLNDVEDIIMKMAQLRELGVGFSLDDFGTGYSSLSYLKRLPIDQLKIDQSFVRDVLTDPNDAAIVRTILALAESLDLAVVAEGVETPGQLEFLVRSGCREFQGYLFGRPAPVQVMLGNLLPVVGPVPSAISDVPAVPLAGH